MMFKPSKGIIHNTIYNARQAPSKFSSKTTHPPLYSPLSLSCVTLNAVSSNSLSSFVWLAFKPVATLALGFRPAYMTCFRSWCSVWLSRVSILGWVKLHAPALRGSSWHQTIVLAFGYISRFSFSCCHGKGFSCSMRVMAASLMPSSARCLWRAA